jgi:hypothetical protein
MRQCATTLQSEISYAEMDSLLDVLSRKKFKEAHLEIGTAAGGTLCQLNCFYRKNVGLNPLFVVVDPLGYFPNQFEIVCQNLEKHGIDPAEIKFLKSSSKVAFLSVSADPPDLDFILVDGNHKIRYVTEDLRWARFLRVGGILCAHDYSPSHPGVYLSLKRFLKKHKNYKILSQVETLLIIEKSEPTPSGVLEISFWDRLLATLRAPLFQLKASLVKRLKVLS